VLSRGLDAHKKTAAQALLQVSPLLSSVGINPLSRAKAARIKDAASGMRSSTTS